VPNVEVDVVKVDIDGFAMVAGGLRPPAPSSVEPNGTPTRATVDPAIPVGDEADAAGPAKEALSVEGQVPDADPATPPPSNTVGDIEVPAVETPVPDDVPDMELPIPDELPVIDDVCVAELPMVEVPRPNDDSGIEPPIPRHPEAVTAAGPSADVLGVIGLTPGDASSIAPRGMRTGGTGEAEPTPSGDVMPSGGRPGETCAKAGLQPKSTAAVAAITKRVIGLNLISTLEFVVRRPAHLTTHIVTRRDITSRGLSRLARCCSDQ
jgi:hypothetical protein